MSKSRDELDMIGESDACLCKCVKHRLMLMHWVCHHDERRDECACRDVFSEGSKPHTQETLKGKVHPKMIPYLTRTQAILARCV